MSKQGGATFIFNHENDAAAILEYKYEQRAELMLIDIKNMLASSVSPLVQKIFNKSLHNSAIFSMSTCSYKSILGVISEG